MIKYYCDICEKEICHDEAYSLNPKPLNIVSIDLESMHFCSKCLQNLIKHLKYAQEQVKEHKDEINK